MQMERNLRSLPLLHQKEYPSFADVILKTSVYSSGDNYLTLWLAIDECFGGCLDGHVDIMVKRVVTDVRKTCVTDV